MKMQDPQMHDHKRTKARNVIMIAIFIMLTATAWFLWIPLKNVVNTENTEKRELSSMPSVTETGIRAFPSLFEDWVNDHIPFRNQMISLRGAVEYGIFHSSTNSSVIPGKSDWLFNNMDGAMDAYLGTDTLTQEQLRQIAENLITVRDEAAAQGAEFVLYIAPDKDRVYSRYMPGSCGEPSDTYAVSQIVSYLRENTDIRVVYPLEELQNASQELEDQGITTYMKGDTHWNKLGAYIGARPLMAELGVSMPSWDSSRVSITTEGNASCDLADMMGIRNLYPVTPLYSVEQKDRNPSEVDEYDIQTAYRFHATGADPRKIYLYEDSFGYFLDDVIRYEFDSSVMTFGDNKPSAVMPEEKPDIFVYETVTRLAVSRLSDLSQLY